MVLRVHEHGRSGRFGGLPYDELLDEHGRQVEFGDIDDVVSSGLEPAPVREPGGMDVNEVMAQIIVTDLERSTAFYRAPFGGPPDVNPMPKLHEWHLDGAGAIQVYEEPERAGRSGATLHVADLDAAAAHLDAAGIAHEPIADVDHRPNLDRLRRTATGSCSPARSRRRSEETWRILAAASEVGTSNLTACRTPRS